MLFTFRTGETICRTGRDHLEDRIDQHKSLPSLHLQAIGGFLYDQTFQFLATCAFPEVIREGDQAVLVRDVLRIPHAVVAADGGDSRGYTVVEQKLFTSSLVPVTGSNKLLRVNTFSGVVHRRTDDHEDIIVLHIDPIQSTTYLSRNLGDNLSVKEQTPLRAERHE